MRTKYKNVQETHFSFNDIHRLKVKGWKKFSHANWNYNCAEVAILISNKTDRKPNMVTREKEGNYIMIKGSIHQEDIIIISRHAPNIRTVKYIEQVVTSEKINRNKITKKGLQYPTLSNG